jgi:hypothetical protein
LLSGKIAILLPPLLCESVVDNRNSKASMATSLLPKKLGSSCPLGTNYLGFL